MQQSCGSSFNERTGNVVARFHRAEDAHRPIHSAQCTAHFRASPVHRVWNRLAPPLTAGSAKDQPQRGPFTGLLGDGLEPNRALSGLKPAPQEAPSNGAAAVIPVCSTRRQRRADTSSSPVNRANWRGRDGINRAVPSWCAQPRIWAAAYVQPPPAIAVRALMQNNRTMVS